MKKVLFTICFLGLFGIVNAQFDSKALTILDAMSAQYKDAPSFMASFTYTLENEIESINEEFSGEIIVKGEKFKLDLGEQVIYNDGETIWTYLKDVNEVNIDYYIPEDGDLTPSTIFTAYQKGYKYIFTEETTLNKQTYNVVDLVPDDQDNSFFKVRLWINKNDSYLKMWKMFDKTGNTYLYTIVKYDGKYPAKDVEFVFDTSKYPGITEIDLR